MLIGLPKYPTDLSKNNENNGILVGKDTRNIIIFWFLLGSTFHSNL